MNQHESRIRDYLCQHLELIESGMLLVQKEYKIQSENGAGGSIDILARDFYGHFVIIEIKRSNQAARAALHELTKYIALLQSSLGIQTEKIRVLLLSTEWHELAVPFSEYLKSVEVATHGFWIDANQEGVVQEIRPFIPLTLATPLKVERVQNIYFFRDADDRDSALKGIVSAANEASILDFFIFAMDYGGESPQVIHPHAAYFVFSAPVDYENPDSLQEFIDATEIDWEDLEEPGENFLCWLGDRLSIEYDSMEIGFPEKLNSMMSGGWSAQIAHRGGRYTDNAGLLTEAILLAQARQIEGGAGLYLYRTCSPRFKSGWGIFKNDLSRVVSGCSAWEQVIAGILQAIETKRPDATVSIYMYNPTDIVLTIAKASAHRDYRFLPSFQLIESSPTRVCTYLGFLAWTGSTPNFLGDEFLSRYFDGTEGYFLTMNFGELYTRYDAACSALGLESIVVEVLNPGAPTESARLLRRQVRNADHQPTLPFEQFIAENELFNKSLVRTLRSFAFGFV
ncbi:DUF91 domain-containing protein [Chromobacterium phragmitis]|uniref:endonuclease NucS domain-containing protein n=1 Tax=Chromobacterium phragmitis TaxID=2202141 RepID=UPI000DED1800|nr:endonuclease NucS domain-containing protein [Chromobacterium phragmitis]AXE29476.1 DUF91 domain-containing protein [Chromobacterium phragmitis]